MENLIILKNSNVKGKTPEAKKLEFGEVAVNTNDGLLYIKRADKNTTEVVSISSDVSFSQKVEFISGELDISVDCSNRQIKVIEIQNHSNILFIKPFMSGTLTKVRLYLNNLGDFAVAWNNKMIWENGISPIVEAKSWTIIEVETFDGGKTYFGTQVGSSYKEA